MEERSVHILRLIGKILGITALLSLGVVILGYFLHWKDPLQYSNAFFWAGSLLIVLGVLSVEGGFAQRANFAITYTESAGDANIAERNQRIAADITQRYGSMILLTATGILLIIVSVVIGQTLI